MNPTLSWPTGGVPQVLLSGYFPLKDKGFRTIYQIQAVAMHLYDYAGTVRMDGRPIELRSGDLTLTPVGMATTYDLPAAGRHWCVHVLPATIGTPLRLPLHIRLGSDATIARERLARITAYQRRGRGRHEALASSTAAGAAVLELVAWLADRLPDGPQQRGDRAVERAASLLREDPARGWRVPHLARTVGVSPAYLARRFRQRYGSTLARFQLAQRIGSAQALLACTELSVGEIGRRIGLPDAHHFNKLFRRVAGVPPTAFRAEHRA